MENPPQEERMTILIIAALMIAAVGLMARRRDDIHREIARMARQSVRAALNPPQRRDQRWN